MGFLHQFKLRLHHYYSLKLNVIQKFAGLWLVGYVVNHLCFMDLRRPRDCLAPSVGLFTILMIFEVSYVWKCPLIKIGYRDYMNKILVYINSRSRNYTLELNWLHCGAICLQNKICLLNVLLESIRVQITCYAIIFTNHLVELCRCHAVIWNFALPMLESCTFLLTWRKQSPVSQTLWLGSAVTYLPNPTANTNSHLTTHPCCFATPEIYMLCWGYVCICTNSPEGTSALPFA